jgi:two-component system response regulator TctD
MLAASCFQRQASRCRCLEGSQSVGRPAALAAQDEDPGGCLTVRILVVEDDPDLGDAIQRRLRRDGYAVDLLADGKAADEVLQYQSYEVVLLDIGLPGMDGFSVLRALRRRGDRTPVLMLTARSDIEDRVTALDVGADDYLPKPFDFRELDARCRALMRRTQGLASSVTKIGKLTFDRSAKLARLGDIQVNLPNREYRLLEIFVGNLGRVLSKDQIASQLFDFDNEAGTNAIELYVGRLRRKLAGALTIKTLRGLGYVAEIGEASGEGPDAG